MVLPKSVFELAQLAEASYASLENFTLKDAVQNQDKDLGAEMTFSAAQAQALTEKWHVVTHQPNTQSGYSSTLFQNNEGRYVLAFRGTEPGDAYADLLSADLGDIVGDGLAIKQIVDMYNEWQRITAPQGFSYTAARLSYLSVESAAYAEDVLNLGSEDPAIRDLAQRAIDAFKSRTDVVFDGLAAYTIEFEDSATVFDDGRASGLGLAADIATHGLTVTGHSLGGHLASAFTRLFPGAGASALTVNGAGYPTGTTPGLGGMATSNIAHLFSMLGGASSFDSSRITNVYGDAMPEFVTMDETWGLVQPGGHVPMFIEQSTLLGNTLGHGASQMTDSTAVYDLFFRIDPALSALPIEGAFGLLKPIFEASSNVTATSLEHVVTALGGIASVALPSPLTDGDRQALYKDIQAVQAGLEGGVSGAVTGFSGMDAETVAGLGRSDIGYRYAMVHLLPFAIVGPDYSSANADGALNYSPDGGPGLTDKYLEDRAAMLAWKIQYDNKDKDYGSDWNNWDPRGDWDYIDRSTVIDGQPLKIAIDGLQLNTSTNHKVVFGSDASEADILGDSLSDDLYGGGGTDILYGGAGNDYLEGGGGNDTLIGGGDWDRLVGGSGFDTYVYTADGAMDTVRDSDGQGKIRYLEGGSSETILDGGSKIGDGVYQSEDGKYRYTLIGDSLHIVGPNGSLLVENFTAGDLGIQLNSASAPNSPSTGSTIGGDLLWKDSDEGLPGIQVAYDGLGNPIYDEQNIAVPGQEDTLYDSAGSDLILPGDGNDIVVASRGGNDEIRGAGGQDYLDAGDGQDLVEGGDGTDILRGGAGNDRLYADGEIDIDAALAADIGVAGPDRDWLNGGSGDDLVVGNAGGNGLAGGGGNDVIVAGAGDDNIFGDDDWTAQTFDWTYADTLRPDGGIRRAFIDVDGIDDPPDSGADTIYAGSGTDFVWAGAGDDVVFAGIGNDHVVGDAGNDTLLGGDGKDYVWGDGRDLGDVSLRGLDYIDGGAGDDELYGGGGDDWVFGGDDNDLLVGDGDEQLVAGQFHGDDYLDGGAGKDELQGGGGNDTLVGGFGNDTLFGDMTGLDAAYHGDDILYGDAGEDVLIGEGGSDRLYGGDDHDILLGDDDASLLDVSADGDDYLDGGAGDDEIAGYGGSDTLIGGTGDDTLVGGAGSDCYEFNPGDGADVVVAEEGDRLVFGGGIASDSLTLTPYQSDDGGVYLDVGYGSSGDHVMVRNAFLGGVSVVDTLVDGEQSVRVLVGKISTPLNIEGTDSDETVLGAAGADTLEGGGGNDTLYGNAGNDTLGGGDGDDRLEGEDGNDTLSGGAGDDTLVGGAGEDSYQIQWGMGSDQILEDGANTSYLRLSTNMVFTDLIATQDGEDWVVSLRGGSGQVRLSGAAVSPDQWQVLDSQGNTLTVDRLPQLVGIEGAMADFESRVRGEFGASVIASGGTPQADGTFQRTRTNTYQDGYGNTTYRSIKTTDRYVFQAQSSDDAYIQRLSQSLVTSSATDSSSTVSVGSYTAAPGSSGMLAYGGTFVPSSGFSGIKIRSLASLVGVYSDSLVLGNNSGGSQSLSGYWMYGSGARPAGIQYAATTHTTTSVENTFTVERINAGDSDNFVSTRGNSIVDGGGGNDTIWAVNGTSNPYAVKSIATRYDGPYSDQDYGSFLYGNTGDDLVLGSQVNDTLSGGDGVDFLDGEGGQDTYYVDASMIGEDIIADSGRLPAEMETGTTRYSDWYYQSIGMSECYPLGPDCPSVPDIAPNDYDALAPLYADGVVPLDTVEFGPGITPDQLVLSWGEYAPQARPELDYGGVGTTWTDAGYAHSTLDISWGGSGKVRVVIPHTKFVENSLDGSPRPIVRGLPAPTHADPGVGIERFQFSDGSVLTMGQLLALAPPAPSFDPQDQDNVLVGGVFDDTLYGAGGNDVLKGGAGEDTLDGGDGADALYGGEGDDALYGSAGNDALYGGAGNDTLDGGLGNDTIETGAGNDITHGGEGNDTITGGDNPTNAFGYEFLYGDEGDDWLQAAGKLALVYGGAGNDVLIGGKNTSLLYGEEGNDILSAAGGGYTSLNGGAGSDWMIGNGLGNSYWVDDPGDMIFEGANGGTDVVYSSISYVLQPVLEQLKLTGTDAISGTGNDANNMLDGSANKAANVLTGGLGDDTYILGEGDTIVEREGEGIDTVSVSFSYSLADNLENLILRGSSDIDGIGNASDNHITGNYSANRLSGGAGNDYLSGMYGNDILDGGAGADKMAGGHGSDTYYVDDAGDVVTELAGQGNDKVNSSISYTLSANVERLTLTGSLRIDGVGNGLANVLVGSDAANVLTGNAGNDILKGMGGDDVLIGGRGHDSLFGGAGSDRYQIARGDGRTVVNDYDPKDADPATYGPQTDVLQWGADIAHDQLWFSRSGDDLQVQVIGTEDQVIVQDWYLGEAHQVEEIHAGDGYDLISGQIDQLVQAMAAFSPPTSGELNLSAVYRSELEPVLAASWHAV